MHSPSQPEAVVRQLLQVISRQLPFSAVPTLLSAHLRAHMDGQKIGSGIRAVVSLGAVFTAYRR